MKIDNVEVVLRAFGDLIAKARAEGEPSVVVGFSASYAIYVHENLTARHPVGQAKFLEQPARALAPALREIVKTAIQKGASLRHALLMAGMRLQREAQMLCPVDTGFLKASAFTRLE